MCGIAGVVAWDDRFRVDRDTLARMSARIAHRGPDGEGLYLNHEAEVTPDRPQVGLVHRRLAIIDPDPRANQPFTDGRGRWIVFNGEIYNFRELRAELKGLKPDYAWRTDCDTEVLLVAYDVWGEKCVERLNGMFAFAVWDEPAGALFLARDRMGQKPLYVRRVNAARDDTAPISAIYFASELAAIPQTDPPLDFDLWGADYLRYGCMSHFAPYVWTGPLAAGWTLLVARDRAESTRAYFHAGHVTSCRLNDESAITATRTLVRRAVERQLVSDVPLGVFLSGGLDSSVVTACARRLGPVQTFSIRFDDPRYDESPHARAVAEHLGTRHHEFTVTPDAVTDLPKLAAAFGEPFADSSALPTHYLARASRQHVKVALGGDGGDELFGGYDRYRALRLSRYLAPLRVLAPLGPLLAAGHPKGPAHRLGRLLGSLGGPAVRRYDHFVRIFDDRTIRRLAPRLSRWAPRVECSFSVAQNVHREPVPAALACDRMHYLPDDLLTKIDRCSMLHALEVRSPFMDHELVHFAAGLTTAQLLRGGPKRMLREAFAADLPAWVFKRRKMGFAVPIGDWFRGELRPMLRDHLFAADSFAAGHFQTAVVRRLVDEHEAGRVDHSQRLYALLMLELWWRTQRA